VFLSLLTFEIDLWGRRRLQTKAARAQLASSEEDRKTVATVVVSESRRIISTCSSWIWNSRSQNELSLLARVAATYYSAQQGGLATMLDVRQAEELVYQASQNYS